MGHGTEGKVLAVLILVLFIALLVWAVATLYAWMEKKLGRELSWWEVVVVMCLHPFPLGVFVVLGIAGKL